MNVAQELERHLRDMHFIIKLFPEIIVKSAPVRRRFIKQLQRNLQRLTERLGYQVELERDWEKIQITAAGDDPARAREIASLLARTPGVGSFARGSSYPLGDIADIADKTCRIYEPLLRHKTFCVRVKRSGKHGFSSMDIERSVGAHLMRHCAAAGVDLTRPDVTVRLDIRDDRLFVVEQEYPGLGGYPLGTQDPVLSLISGGFDSSVASCLTMKRGLITHFCFFILGGRAHEVGVKEVAHYLWNRYGASHSVKFVTVPFEAVVAEILTQVQNSQMGVILKRMMLRAASRIAAQLQIDALVTGESIGQVSSQTLPNLAIIDSVCDRLTLRPLIAMDKNDIIDISRHIGTEVFAANMPEYCGVISVKPTTRAHPQVIAREEGRFDFSILEDAIAAANIQRIDGVLEQMPRLHPVEVFTAPQPNTVIVDIRHPDETAQRRLDAGSVRVEEIPFFVLQKRAAEFDKQQRYLLYCQQGVMSHVHAELLLESGFASVGVYRPR